MIEGGAGRGTIVAPDGDSKSSGFNDLNRVVEGDYVIWRAGLYMKRCRGAVVVIGRRRFTFVFVGEARNLNVAELELPNQTFEHHQSARPLDGIVIEMSVS